MSNKSKKIILYTSLFLILLVPTVLLGAIFKTIFSYPGSFTPANFFALYLLVVKLIVPFIFPVLIACFELWNLVKYFWVVRDYKQSKTILNCILFAFSVFFLWWSVVSYPTASIMLSVWVLCYILFRTIHAVADAVYRMVFGKTQGKHRSKHS